MNSDFWLEVPEGNSFEKVENGKKVKHIMVHVNPAKESVNMRIGE